MNINLKFIEDMQQAIASSYGLVEQATNQGLNFKKFLNESLFPPSKDKIKAVCLKPIEDKTLEDVLLALRALDQFSSFSEYRNGLDDQEFIIIGLCLRYKAFDSYEAVCRIGEAPTEIFYVLDGVIGVTNLTNRFFSEEILDGKVFHTESSGATLGEASILYNSNRTATLVTVQPTELLLVNKEPFMRTIGDMMRKAHLSRIEMLQRISILEQWSLAQLASLYKHFIKKDYTFNSIVYEQGQTDENIYVVLKGEVEVVTLLTLAFDQ